MYTEKLDSLKIDSSSQPVLYFNWQPTPSGVYFENKKQLNSLHQFISANSLASLVAGEVGCGKTVLIQQYIEKCFYSGENVNIIRFGGSESSKFFDSVIQLAIQIGIVDAKSAPFDNYCVLCQILFWFSCSQKPTVIYMDKIEFCHLLAVMSLVTRCITEYTKITVIVESCFQPRELTLKDNLVSKYWKIYNVCPAITNCEEMEVLFAMPSSVSNFQKKLFKALNYNPLLVGIANREIGGNTCKISYKNLDSFIQSVFERSPTWQKYKTNFLSGILVKIQTTPNLLDIIAIFKGRPCEYEFLCELFCQDNFNDALQFLYELKLIFLKWDCGKIAFVSAKPICKLLATPSSEKAISIYNKIPIELLSSSELNIRATFYFWKSFSVDENFLLETTPKTNSISTKLIELGHYKTAKLLLERHIPIYETFISTTVISGGDWKTYLSSLCLLIELNYFLCRFQSCSYYLQQYFKGVSKLSRYSPLHARAALVQGLILLQDESKLKTKKVKSFFKFVIKNSKTDTDTYWKGYLGLFETYCLLNKISRATQCLEGITEMGQRFAKNEGNNDLTDRSKIFNNINFSRIRGIYYLKQGKVEALTFYREAFSRAWQFYPETNESFKHAKNLAEAYLWFNKRNLAISLLNEVINKSGNKKMLKSRQLYYYKKCALVLFRILNNENESVNTVTVENKSFAWTCKFLPSKSTLLAYSFIAVIAVGLSYYAKFDVRNYIYYA